MRVEAIRSRRKREAGILRFHVSSPPSPVPTAAVLSFLPSRRPRTRIRRIHQRTPLPKSKPHAAAVHAPPTNGVNAGKRSHACHPTASIPLPDGAAVVVHGSSKTRGRGWRGVVGRWRVQASGKKSVALSSLERSVFGRESRKGRQGPDEMMRRIVEEHTDGDNS